MKKQFKADGIGRYSLDGPLDAVIENLTAARDETLEEFPDATSFRLDVEAGEEWGCPVLNVNLFYMRKETATESAERELIEKQQKDQNDKWKREQLKWLKEELGEL